MNKYLKTKEGSLEDLAKQMQNKVIESDYQDKFKKELDKAGKPIGHMTGAEKKAFFNKIDKMHTAKNEQANGHSSDEKKKEKVNETHSFVTNKQNEKQKEVGGEKSPISHMKNKSVQELSQNTGKTFAEMAAELKEKKEEKKELHAGDDTRDKKVKTMTGEIATTPEMNPKVDYKY